MNLAVSTIQNLRSNNRALLLEQLRQQATSRVDLAQKTGLAKSAVTTIVNELIRDDIVRECSIASAPRAGRPAVLLDIAPQKLFGIGLIINRSNTLLCAVDLKCNVLQSQQLPTRTFRTPSECTDWIYHTVDTWFASPETPMENCIGFSVGAAGPVDRAKGIIRNPPDFKRFHNYPIVQILRRRYSLPIVFENVAVLFAQAEYLHGTMQNYHNTLFVFWVENGIGSVILNDGVVYRGFGSFAGEIGHTCVEPGGIQCACGSTGCLEAYLKKETTEARFGPFDWHEVVDGAMLGQPRAIEILDYYVRYLGIALSNAINFMDPDSICLYLADHYKPACILERLSAYLNQHAVICQSHRVDLISASIPYSAPAAASVSPLLTMFFQSGGNLTNSI